MEQQSVVTSDTEVPLTALEVVVRALWIAVQIVAVLYLGQPGALFFYQAF